MQTLLPFYNTDPPKENYSIQYISFDQFIIEQNNQRQTQIQEKSSIFCCITSHLNGQFYCSTVLGFGLAHNYQTILKIPARCKHFSLSITFTLPKKTTVNNISVLINLLSNKISEKLKFKKNLFFCFITSHLKGQLYCSTVLGFGLAHNYQTILKIPARCKHFYHFITSILPKKTTVNNKSVLINLLSNKISDKLKFKKNLFLVA